MKRVFDIFFSALVIVFILSWLIPVIGVCIKLSTGGSIFYMQQRLGINGKIFKCIKFRTMKTVVGEEVYMPVKNDDSRVTRIGSFLRKTGLDEFPQFLNVLKGDMSIVGPRPHAVHFNDIYASFVDSIGDRLTVKPGITGLAQVLGYRGDVANFHENKLRTRRRVKYDIFYIRHFSLRMDMWIICKTIGLML